MNKLTSFTIIFFVAISITSYNLFKKNEDQISISSEDEEIITDVEAEDIVRKYLKLGKDLKELPKVLEIPVQGYGSISNPLKFNYSDQKYLEDLENFETFLETTDFGTFLKNRFKKNEIIEIIRECSKTDTRVNREVSFFQLAIWGICDFNVLYLALDNDDLKNALETFPAAPTGVKYKGDISVMEYSDIGLLDKVNIISIFLMSNKLKFRNVFFNLPSKVQDKFRQNSYTTDESSKSEPFDLIHHSITKSLNAVSFGYYHSIKKQIDYIELNKVIKKALLQAFLVSNKDDIFGWRSPSLLIKKSDEAFEALCANGIFRSDEENRIKFQDGNGISDFSFENEFGSGNIVEKWSFDKEYLDNVILNERTSNLRCGTDHFTLQFKPIKAIKIANPKPLLFQSEIHAFMTISLVEEIGKDEQDLLKKYLEFLKSWTIVSDFTQVDTKKQFEELFVKSDMYLPVSHSMEINSFLVGTEKSNYIVFSKEFKDQEQVKKVYLHLLLPTGGKDYLNSVVYNTDDLAQLYSKRRKLKSNSLFLMNISCGSEGTLGTWTSVFRKSVSFDIKAGSGKSFEEYKDLPYIIGSKRSFAADSSEQLAQHINFPLQAIGILAEGGGINSVMDFLTKTNDKDFITGVLSLFSNNDSKSYIEDESFDPVLNINNPEMLTYGGFEIHLKNKYTGESKVY